MERTVSTLVRLLCVLQCFGKDSFHSSETVVFPYFQWELFKVSTLVRLLYFPISNGSYSSICSFVLCIKYMLKCCFFFSALLLLGSFISFDQLLFWGQCFLGQFFSFSLSEICGKASRVNCRFFHIFFFFQNHFHNGPSLILSLIHI